MSTHKTIGNRQIDLPYAEQKFRGVVGTTYLNSDPAEFPQPLTAPEGAPNVLVVLIDDAGFGQFSVAGGGVPAPHMEKLAQEGVFFNRFHTTALCSPTRAALLTGRNHHVAASGAVTELATGYDGYTGIIPKDTATIGEILRQNGYITAWFGKNHNTPAYEASVMGPFDHWPNALGFDHFYGFMAGDTNQIRPNMFCNQNALGTPQEPDYYISVDLADRAIDWLQHTEAIQPEKPWFVYIAPGATHSPHQAPKELIEKFKGQFSGGWDVYREQTLARQQKMGLIPEDTDLTTRPDSMPAWDTLDDDEKRLYERIMEVFAAFGYHVDQQIGRVLDYIESLPDGDNTLIMYIVGDNGASAEGGLTGTLNELAFFNGYQMGVSEMIDHIDEIGTERHFNHFPAGWALAMDTPFPWTKQAASHLGGVRNPMIVKWPARYQTSGEVRSQFTHLIDVAPTILAAAGIDEPRSVNGTAQTPMQGRSFLAAIGDAEAPEHRTSQYFEIFANRGMYNDGWWAACLASTPWNPNRDAFDPVAAKWELYNLEDDFSQAHDLSEQHPAKLEELKALWWAAASANQVLPLDWRGVERFSNAITGRPSVAGERTHFVYPGVFSGLPEAAAPDLKNKSFTISASIEIDDDANGMIFIQGGNTGGWGFYLKDGVLTMVHNYVDAEWYFVRSDKPLAKGSHQVKATFSYDGGKDLGKGGSVVLTVDDQQVGTGTIERTCPNKYSNSENQDIGIDTGTPITYEYQTPFLFQGTLHQVVVDLVDQ